ncbi:DUF3800 domain-containing protein [Corynebacterium sp. 35RC1]|nr:DUF3800 domain-containing protein [Corynebacterium sp. 35RC1]
MLLAYIDEIGHTGAFAGIDHPRYSDSPAFGYAGFIIPEERAREFGAKFTVEKRTLFATEIEQKNEHPGRFEKKGASLLYANSWKERPQNLRVLGSLIKQLRSFGGYLFYYAEEKPFGTPKETNCGPAEFAEREANAMRETLNRIARHADYTGNSVLVMMDQINEKSRKQRLPAMYQHILGRATEHEDMRRIIEPPMHIDSQLSSNIQFADWVATLAKRAIEYQLVATSRYTWIPDSPPSHAARGAFTYESKLHLYERGMGDLVHSKILNAQRPVLQSINDAMRVSENFMKLERVRKATIKEQNNR